MTLAVHRLLHRGSGLWIAFAVLVALMTVVRAAEALLTRFSAWDDEGYMLVSLTHYLSEGQLYTKTFSQYGPFCFWVQGISNLTA